MAKMKCNLLVGGTSDYLRPLIYDQGYLSQYFLQIGAFARSTASIARKSAHEDLRAPVGQSQTRALPIAEVVMRFTQTDTSRHQLLVAISVHYRADRLPFLFDVLRTLSEFLVGGMEVHIVTNATYDADLARIDHLCRLTSAGRFTYVIDQFGDLADPFVLAWCHKPLIRDVFLDPSRGFTHFIHVEEDIRFSYANFQYWLAFREPLDGYGLIPGFVRMEYRGATHDVVATDAFGQNAISDRRFLPLGPYKFACLDNPHHAMFVLDHALAKAYVPSRSFDMERSKEVHPWWWTVERAAMGVAFEDVPFGYSTRFVVGLDVETLVPVTPAWVHHLPNNYADADVSPHQLGRIGLASLFA